MDVLYWAYCGALFALPIILYKLCLPSNPANGQEKRAKDWYYALKRLLCYRKMEKFMRRTVMLPDYVPEKPTESWEEDALIFHGVDLDNNAIYIRFTTGRTEGFHKFAEIAVQLRLSDGRIFTLPENVIICSLRRREWRTKVLTIIPQLNGNYRILFNGYLKEISANNDDFNIEHLSFNFLFSRATDPMLYPGFFNKGLFADAICRERWRDGNWTQKLGDAIGKENFGVIHGTIKSAHFNLDDQWYLVAHQNRRFGTGHRYVVDKEVTLFALTDDGTAVHVEYKRITNPVHGSCHVKHGAILLPGGDCVPITDTDLVLPNYYGGLNNMTIHVDSSRLKLKCLIHTKPHSETKFTSPHSDFSWEITNTMAEVTIPGSNGCVSLLMFRKRQGTGERMPDPLIGSRLKFPDEPIFVVSLQSTNAQDLNQTGGKGQSLAILASLQTQLNFKVPDGFVITSNAMETNFRSNPKIRAAIANLKLADTLDKIKQNCHKMQSLIIETPVLETLQLAISKELRNLSSGKDAILVAVRSSGVAEDSETSSAAGQNETFLGCRTASEIFKALQKCWASLYSFRSVEYRRNRGLDVETTMGVVVQVMIDSRIAGVLFTCDLDGNPSRIRITSNFGLGESIVSGEEGGDIVMVKRTWNNNISIENVQVNTKKTKITLNKEHTGEANSAGTMSVFLSDFNSKSMSISDDEIVTLAKVATQLEQKYGRHLDIEWAYDEEKLVFLQARPVTFLENWTDYELEHEFDHPVICKKNVYTTANVKEVMPGAMTPLANSTICTLVDRSVGISKGRKDIRRLQMVTIRHHTFLDFFQVLLIYPPEKVGTATHAVDVSVCGHPVTTQTMINRAILIHGKTTPLRQFHNIWSLVISSWKAPKLVKDVKELASEPLTISEAMTVNDIFKVIDYHIDKFLKIICIHSETSRASSFYQMVSMNILGSQGEGSLTPEKYAQIALLFSNGSGVISAEIPSDLEAIASAIRKSPKRAEFIKGDTDTLDAWLHVNIPEAGAIYAKFLKDHGHRSFREFEIMEPSWSTKPSTIMKMLQTLTKLDDSTKKSSHMTIDEVIKQMHTKMSKSVLKFLIGKCRTGVVNREKSKSEVVRQVDNLRKGFQILGERLQRLQYLPQKELLYFLTYDETKHLVATRDSVLVTKAMRRSRLYLKWNDYKFPEINEGIPYPIESRKRKVHSVDGKLTGTPVCSGYVQARCCSIENLAHIDQLQQGDVLVTHGTDVGWTPYFPMLSGVVTELGGLISHGAVVAREYGLPCLIGVEGALDTFRTGDQIVLDADNGTIYKIKPENI